MKNKTHKLSMLIGATLLAVTAAGAAGAQNLRVGLASDPDVLDPHRSRTYVGRIVFTSLCEKLIDIDPKLNFVPQLAESWSWNDDNTVLTFKLRSGVVFHDGTPFNAEAARANLERARTLPDSLVKADLASVEKLEAPDDQTLVITLKQPDATLMALLSDRTGMMLSPAAFAGDDAAAFGRKPVCSGPYTFNNRVQNDRIVLDKFDKHRDADKYHFERITYLPIPDTTVRLANLRSGDLDMIEALNPSDVPQVKQDRNVQFVSAPGLGYYQIYFNTHNGARADSPWGKDKRIRQAFELAIDRNVINDVVANGVFQVAAHPFPPASPFHDAKFEPGARDVAKARALLKEAGHERVKIEFMFANATLPTSIAEMVQAMVAEAGIDLDLRPTEFASMLQQGRAGNFDIMMSGWSGRVDPDGNIYPFLASDGANNDGRYSNEKLDALLKTARTTVAEEERKKLYSQALEIVREDVPRVYLYYPSWLFVLGGKVQGYTAYPDGLIRLKDVKFSG